jgi:ankyrin repeat protein
MVIEMFKRAIVKGLSGDHIGYHVGAGCGVCDEANTTCGAQAKYSTLLHHSHILSCPPTMTEIKPSTYIASILGCKRRIRSQFSIIEPDGELLDAYDVDVARAIRSNNVALLRQLLDDGRCFDGVNRNGESLLHLACRRGNYDVVEFLVYEAGVNVDVVDNMGRSVLHDVLWRPHYQQAMELMVLLLCIIPPELLVSEDIRGHSCFDYCRKVDYDAWIDFIKKYSTLIQRRAKLAGLCRRDSLTVPCE